jgi:RNA polymerase sigma-70 factor (ECF subfamily)
MLLSRLAVDPEQEWRLRYKELLRAIDLLPSAARESLLLVAVSGLTYEEAAVVCGCSVGTVKSRVNRARAKLLKLMEGAVDPEPTVSPRLAAVM